MNITILCCILISYKYASSIAFRNTGFPDMRKHFLSQKDRKENGIQDDWFQAQLCKASIGQAAVEYLRVCSVTFNFFLQKQSQLCIVKMVRNHCPLTWNNPVQQQLKGENRESSIWHSLLETAKNSSADTAFNFIGTSIIPVSAEDISTQIYRISG